MKAKKQTRAKRVHVFPIEADQCIWVKIGMVDVKSCDNAFDCVNCPFDKAMTRSIEEKPETVMNWRQTLKHKPYQEKECRHMLSGRVQFRLCGNAYRCDTCQFDQALDDHQLEMPVEAFQAENISGAESFLLRH